MLHKSEQQSFVFQDVALIIKKTKLKHTLVFASFFCLQARKGAHSQLFSLHHRPNRFRLLSEPAAHNIAMCIYSVRLMADTMLRLYIAVGKRAPLHALDLCQTRTSRVG